ncbi:hypothetical protein ACOSQ2_005584 [Xanthoceras sorbifolium]|uniref:Uncharacterized protein n=1 Tax=Xanthoceras sorbifolium TaxID=99658 RepID=A0ABQ8IF26_9ROSI|nr:hypothetical protein JRO89_XS02G0067400 [Xanthoceras sorbifolium]
MSMACLNMYNNEHSMDPRISFSNDFADTQQAAVKQESNYREAPVSSDFEFSVRNFNLIPADEIFFKGKLVPLKDNSSTQLRKMTLREELLVDDNALPRIPKSSGWWKDRLGLKKAHIISKKGDRNDGVLADIAEEKSCVFAHQEEPVGKTIQELLLNCGDAGI